jgi:hypothetical protein
LRAGIAPATVSVDEESDFLPSAVYLDLEASNWNSTINTSAPLVCGCFDCQYVQSRGRFAMVDTPGGFYMFRGFCQESCFVLTAVFTPSTASSGDYLVVIMVASVSGFAGLAVLAAMTFSWYRQKRRKQQTDSNLAPV